MNTKELIEKYIVMKQGEDLVGNPTRWAHLNLTHEQQLNLGLTLGEAKCVKCGPTNPFVTYGLRPVREMAAPNFSNFAVPPLCGEHLLVAAEEENSSIVQALLAIEEKLCADDKRRAERKAYWESPEGQAEKATRKTHSPRCISGKLPFVSREGRTMGVTTSRGGRIYPK